MLDFMKVEDFIVGSIKFKIKVQVTKGNLFLKFTQAFASLYLINLNESRSWREERKKNPFDLSYLLRHALILTVKGKVFITCKDPLCFRVPRKEVRELGFRFLTSGSRRTGVNYKLQLEECMVI